MEIQPWHTGFNKKTTSNCGKRGVLIVSLSPADESRGSQEAREQRAAPFFSLLSPALPCFCWTEQKGEKKTCTLPLPQPFSECTLIYLPGNLCFSCLFSLNSHSFLTPLFSNSQMLSHVFAVISYPFFLLTRTRWHILLTTPNFPSLFFPYDKEVCQTLENTYC